MSHFLVVFGREGGQSPLQESLGVQTFLTGETGVEGKSCSKPKRGKIILETMNCIANKTI